MERLRKCVACGFEDFEDNINNFCCWCGKDIDTGLTLEEMEEKGIPYILDKRKINLQQNQENTGLEPSEVEQLKANQNKIAIEKLGELENWINQSYTKGDCYYLNRGATIETTDLQQKKKELKGDK